jgi:hypothetical protein
LLGRHNSMGCASGSFQHRGAIAVVHFKKAAAAAAFILPPILL